MSGKRSSVEASGASTRALTSLAAARRALRGTGGAGADSPDLARTAAGAALHGQASTTRSAEIIAVSALGRWFVIVGAVAAVGRIAHLALAHSSVTDAVAGLGRRVQFARPK